MDKKINSYSSIDQYAMNLQSKIRSSVCKKKNNSPRLNNKNLDMIKQDPEDGNNYNFLREKFKIKEFKKESQLGTFFKSQPNLLSCGESESHSFDSDPDFQFDDEGNLVKGKKLNEEEEA